MEQVGFRNINKKIEEAKGNLETLHRLPPYKENLKSIRQKEVVMDD